MALLSKLPSYPIRLFGWLVGYSVLMIAAIVAWQYTRERNFKAAQVDSRLQLVNTYIITEIGEGRSPSEIDLSQWSHGLGDIRITVIESDGRVIYDNAVDYDRLPSENHLDRKEISSAISNSEGFDVRRISNSTGDSYFYSARLSPDGSYIVRTAVPYSVSLNTLLRADYGFLWAIGGIAILMCGIGYLLTRRIGAHIVRLSRFAENVENGSRISDTEPFPNDELGRISNHIVRLYARLQKMQADRDAEHRAAIHQQQEQQRIKKRLTDNINHELKTPVASIRACLETLESHPEMPVEKREMFVAQALAASQRLSKLLSDISLMARFDEGAGSFGREPLDIGEIAREIADEQRHAAFRKGMTISVAIPCGFVTNGNRTLLESVFANLVDNAVAYSGGSRIDIRVKGHSYKSITIEVSDNGSGVEPVHLPRLFERFYRIDKGRSRASGGTGLGLAIVKNAVLCHGGSIMAANRAGGGLSVVFSIALI